MQEKSYLKYTSLSKTVFWDFYSLSNKNSLFSIYPIVKLKEVIYQRKESIKIDDFELYKRCRVQVQAKGVILRDEVFGKEIKTKKQQLCKTEDFLVAEIDAKVGGYGIVPESLENAIVSGHYFLFEIDKSKLIPDFLGLVVKQYHFSKQIKSTGSTNYAAIRPYHVLEYEIPLPTLEQQKRIIEAYKAKLNIAKQQEKEAKQLEEGIEKYLFEELEIEIKSKINSQNKLQLIKFSDTQRWDALFLLGNLPSIVSKYSLVKFLDVIKYFNKGKNGKTIRIDSPKFPNDDFRYIGMEHIEKVTGILLDMPEVKGKEIKSQTLRIPKNFFIYGKLRPYLNKYWINDTDFDNIICSSEFFVFDTIETLDKLFFKYVLSSKIIQNQISDKTSGARMPRINEDIFFNLQFPLPPIEKQKEISTNINSIKARIKELNVLSVKNREESILEFEKEIFKKD